MYLILKTTLFENNILRAFNRRFFTFFSEIYYVIARGEYKQNTNSADYGFCYNIIQDTKSNILDYNFNF